MRKPIISFGSNMPIEPPPNAEELAKRLEARKILAEKVEKRILICNSCSSKPDCITWKGCKCSVKQRLQDIEECYKGMWTE